MGSSFEDYSFNLNSSPRSQYDILQGDRFIPSTSLMDMSRPQTLLSDKPGQRSPNSTSSEENQKWIQENLTLGSDGKPFQMMLVFRGTPKSGRTSVPPIHKFTKEEIQRKREEDLKLRKRIQQLPKSADRCLDAPNLKDDFYTNPIDWGKNNVLVIALGSEVYLWNAENKKIQKLMEIDDVRDFPTSVAWSKDTKMIAVGFKSSTIQLWDAQTSKVEEHQKILDSGGKQFRMLIFKGAPTSVPHFNEYAKDEIEKNCEEAEKLTAVWMWQSADWCFDLKEIFNMNPDEWGSTNKYQKQKLLESGVGEVARDVLGKRKWDRETSVLGEVSSGKLEGARKKRRMEVGGSSCDLVLRPTLQLPGKTGKKLYLLTKPLESDVIHVIDCLSMEVVLRSEAGFNDSFMLSTKLDGWMLMLRNDLNCPYYFNFISKEYIVLASLPNDVYFPEPRGSFDLKPTERNNTTVLMGNLENWDGRLLTVVLMKKTCEIGWTRFDINNDLTNENRRTQIDGPVVHNNTLVWTSDGVRVEIWNRLGQYRTFNLQSFLPDTPTSLIRRFSDIYVVQDRGDPIELPFLAKIMMGSDPFGGEFAFNIINVLPPLDMMLVKGREGACVASDESKMFLACQFQHHVRTCRVVGDRVMWTENIRCEDCNCEGGFICC